MNAETKSYLTKPKGDIPRDIEQLLHQYRAVRSFTESLTVGLSGEDQASQGDWFCSPVKWHLGHTTWFFETFFLLPHLPRYKAFDSQWHALFNSYYNSLGEQFPQAKRGMLSRPSLVEVQKYRHIVDHAMEQFFQTVLPFQRELVPILHLGLNHEQQHQELIVTDIKYLFYQNPLHPKYHDSHQFETFGTREFKKEEASWHPFEAGMYEIGAQGQEFRFDNEGPRHKWYSQGFRLAKHLVTNGDYLEFMEDGGYRKSGLWMSAGWKEVQEKGWASPLYWQKMDSDWQLFTVAGMKSVSSDEPVCHISFFEADAYARWAGARLPLEQEWEVAAAGIAIDGNFIESRKFHPSANAKLASGSICQLFGDVWEWTSSPYCAYPGYKPDPGTLGEYNGKFMSQQMVLRGGSCATPVSHIRSTYRNFFYPNMRWQFQGIRLAQDLK
ncbi:MAG: ergothioneine biosynthesis protein EgtB [Verrucomicrobiota bacterium]|nr:ergothioneine biosynthesis protein EgtB [Verrucomicrobiota bacterium]